MQPHYVFVEGSSGFKVNHWNSPSTVEEIAADFVQGLVRFQSDEPYLIIGECLGGLIALEMAYQLNVLGKAVNLCILDTPVSNLHRFYFLFQQKFINKICYSINSVRKNFDFSTLKKKYYSKIQDRVQRKDLKKARKNIFVY
jgi:thioesterase domain-containing protein